MPKATLRSVEPSRKAIDLFGRCKARMVLRAPFFAHLLARKPVVWTDQIRTAGTDGRSLYINPEYLASQDVAEGATLLAHEVDHDASEHSARMGDRDPRKWNVACDIVINRKLDVLTDKRGGKLFPLPKGGILDRSFDGLTEEQIYAKLPDPEGDPNDDGSCGGVLPHADSDESGNLTERQRREIHDATQHETLQAAMAAKATGNLPVEISSEIGAMVRPKRDPWRQIEDLIQSRAPVDYSWRKPNRRYLAQDLILPGRDGERMGPVALLFDVSGSVSDDEIRIMGGHALSILDRYDPELILVGYCSSKMHGGFDRFDCTADVAFERRGNGGTAFSPAFEALGEAEVEPDLCIYFTDLEASDFGPEPHYPVIWASTSGPEYRDHVPWGLVVSIRED